MLQSSTDQAINVSREILRMDVFQVLSYQDATTSRAPPSSYCRRILHHLNRQHISCFCKRTRHYNKNSAVQALNVTVRSKVPSRQTFTEPQWLLPIDEGSIHSLHDGAASSSKDSINSDSCKALYKVLFSTSKDTNSGISDPKSSVLLCIIGEGGRCFVCTISPLKVGEIASIDLQSEELISRASGQLRFQRGSKDAITFPGPDLGKLEAIWIAPEAGTWKLEEVSVTVFHHNLTVDGASLVGHGDCRVLQYTFQDPEMLIGDGDRISAAELKPSFMCLFSGTNYLLDSTKKGFELQKSVQESREQGLQEYGILKASLLTYTAVLVTAGTSMSVATGFNDIAKAFAIGGFGGFLYLFLLQRAVDQLPGPDFSIKPLTETSLSSSGGLDPLSTTFIDRIEGKSTDFDSVEGEEGENADKNQREDLQMVENFAGFRPAFTRFALVVLSTFLVARLVQNTRLDSVSTQELLAGAAGFLMCKVAVLLAASKPFPFSNDK